MTSATGNITDQAIKHYAQMLDAIGFPAFLKDPSRHLILANEAYQDLFRQHQKATGNNTLSGLFNQIENTLLADEEPLPDEIAPKNITEKTIIDERNNIHDIILTKTRFSDEAGNPFILGIIHDITEQKWSERIMMARYRLVHFAAYHSLEELLQATVDEVCTLTNSLVGFYHFLEPDQKTLSLQTWSTRTLQESCSAEGKGNHYSIEQAGVWVDCVRERRPIIHNDYASLPNKKGLPPGHTPIIRELTVPVFRKNLIVAILGIGNKATNYGAQDLEVVSLLADLAWDIAEHKRSEEKLHSEEEKFRLFMEYFPGFAYIKDENCRILHINAPTISLIGKMEFEVTGKTNEDWMPQELAERITHDEQRILETGQSIEQERTIQFGQRSCDLWSVKFPIPLPNGHTLIGGLALDITARKHAETRLREQSERLSNLAANIPGIIFKYTVNPDGTSSFLYISEGVHTLLGLDPQHVLADANTLINAVHPTDRATFNASFTESILNQTPWRWEGRCLVDKRVIWLQGTSTPRFLTDGRTMWDGVMVDVTTQKETESELREQRQLLQTILDTAPVMVVFLNTTGELQWVNRCWERVLGWSLEETRERDHHTEIASELRDLAYVIQFIRDAAGLWEDFQVPTRDGHLLETSWISISLEDGSHLGIGLDISERKRVEKRIRRINECLLNLKIDYTTNIEHIVTLCGELMDGTAALYFRIENRALRILSQWPESANYESFTSNEDGLAHALIQLGKEALTFFPDLRNTPFAETDPFIATNLFQACISHTIGCGGEPVGWLCVFYNHPYELTDDDKQILGILASAIQAQEIHDKAESQLRQAQKMEAVGQLAGGVAHDFNNLLQIINGYSEMALEELFEEHPARIFIDEMAKAGQRAAKLVGQLLAFGRRQVMRPENLDLNEVISALLKMLGRLLGEHVKIEFLPNESLGLVCADRGQLEQVVMNLCVNARDAMPSGGTLTIETENIRLDDEYCTSHIWAKPGPFVLLSVADTGCGMDASTIEHIWEPFFTTKGIGEGTGLGLATVYDIVHKHSGLIHVYSELNQGTVFKIYLPMAPHVKTEAQTETEMPALTGTETILLAEDDEVVRNLTRRVLEKAGYTVLQACNGEEAVQLCEQHNGNIDLAMLDVVMPGLGGRATYERLKNQYPHLHFIFASGYSINAVHASFIAKEGCELLQKPYNPRLLLTKIRNLLDTK